MCVNSIVQVWWMKVEYNNEDEEGDTADGYGLKRAQGQVLLLWIKVSTSVTWLASLSAARASGSGDMRPVSILTFYLLGLLDWRQQTQKPRLSVESGDQLLFILGFSSHVILLCTSPHLDFALIHQPNFLTGSSILFSFCFCQFSAIS